MPCDDHWPTTEVWLATPQAAGSLDLAGLDATDLQVWNGLRSPRRRLDFASSRALRQALAGVERKEWRSSLSHSRGHAAIARTAANGSIGVDLEWLVPRDFLGMADTAYAPDEVRELESIEDPVQVCTRFYEIWTLKEAFAKALRLPLGDALRNCCFAAAGSGTAMRLPTRQDWRAIVYAPRPMLRLAVVHVGMPMHVAATPPRTMEWPPRREVDWPMVRSLEGIGTADGAPC